MGLYGVYASLASLHFYTDGRTGAEPQLVWIEMVFRMDVNNSFALYVCDMNLPLEIWIHACHETCNFVYVS